MNVDGLDEMSRIGNENVQDRSTVNGDPYASRAARTSSITTETRPPQIQFPENSMPQKPKSAFFMPNKNTSAVLFLILLPSVMSLRPTFSVYNVNSTVKLWSPSNLLPPKNSSYA